MAWTYEVHELSEGFSAIVYDEHGRRIADHLTEEQARIIAAAPALLAKLQNCVNALNFCIDGMSVVDPFITKVRATRDGAAAIIAKATGEA